MASTKYGKYLEKLGSPGTLGTTSGSAVDWVDDNIKVALIDLADYTPNFATDEFFDVVPGAAVVATTANLTGKTAALGVHDADDTTLPTVTGDVSEALLIYKDTGTASTSPLIVLIDTATNLPITPAGIDIPVVWDNGADKIFAL